jgi:putative acetyltransferase
MRLEGTFTVEPEGPSQPDVRALLQEADSYSAALYPPESIHALDIEALTDPAVRFVVARLNGTAVGSGALVLGEGGCAELKRMFVTEKMRGHGIGRAVLHVLEQIAHRENMSLVRLETGVKQPDAINLYKRLGYTECDPFEPYRSDPYSVFMEKRLAARQR